TDPDTAAVIETHMDGDQAAEVSNLALAICSQGPAYEHDPNYEDGWCVLVPMVNGDGSPLLDTTGEQIFDYQFTDPTENAMKPAIEAMLSAVKNDPTLNGQQYQVIYHGDPVDEDALPPPSSSVLNGAATTLAAVPSGGRGSAKTTVGAASGETVTFSNNG